MRGQGARKVIAENVAALAPLISATQKMNGKKRMCWKCQKEKHPHGGHMKLFAGGPMKFICKECMDAKAAAKEAA